MRTITVLNQKGGVGKTSCCHHLAGAFTRLGKRVLLIDADPQASLSQGFYGPRAVQDLPPEQTIAAVFAGHLPFASDVVRPSGIDGIDLLPGSRAASIFNTPGPEFADEAQQRCLRRFVDEVLAEGRHDLALIDCPPNLHLCSFAALVASDFLIVPLQPEDYGAQGIADVRQSFELVTSGPNPDLKLLGYLLTMTARESVQAAFEASLRDDYPGQVFDATVPRMPVFKEAVAARRPIVSFKPKHQATARIKDVAEEILRRIDLATDYGVLAGVL